MNEKEEIKFSTQYYEKGQLLLFSIVSVLQILGL